MPNQRVSFSPVFFFVAVLWILPLQVLAQRVAFKQTTALLQHKVKLNSGSTILGTIVTDLSKQTGLKIEAAVALRDHILNVEMSDVTCREALDALAELNDWKWDEIGEGHLMISRNVLPVPQQIMDVPAAMISALPRDWRTYLGVDLPLQDALRINGATSTTQTKLNPLFATKARILRLENLESSIIVRDLKPSPAQGSRYKCASLTSRQQEALVRYLYLRALHETNFDLLHSKLAPYQLEFSSAVMEMNGTAFLIGIHTLAGTRDIFEFFGSDMTQQYALPTSPQ